MPGHVIPLWLGILPPQYSGAGHSKVARSRLSLTSPGYTLDIVSLGWIWKEKDDNMIPLYSSYNSTLNDWKLTINATLDTGYVWQDPDSYETSTTPLIIGYIYPNNKKPKTFNTIALFSGHRSSPVQDTLITNAMYQYGDWMPFQSIGYILPAEDIASIVYLEFLSPEMETPILTEPIIDGYHRLVQNIASSTTTTFDFWVRISVVFSWDEPTRVTPGLAYTSNIPIVKEQASTLTIPTDSLITGASAPQLLTTQLNTFIPDESFTFNFGEVNELGYDTGVTAKFASDLAGQSLMPVLYATQAMVSVRFKASISMQNGITFQAYGTYTCINTTSVSLYAAKLGSGSTKMTKGDLTALKPVQLGQNNVAQYPGNPLQRTAPTDASFKASPLNMVALTWKGGEDSETLPLDTSTIGTTTTTNYQKQADIKHYNNISK